MSVLGALEEACESAYWRFDARRKGYGSWKGTPQSERDAFKREALSLAVRWRKMHVFGDILLVLAGFLLGAWVEHGSQTGRWWRM